MKIHALTLNWNGEDNLKKLKPGLMSNFAYVSMRAGKQINDYPVWHIRDNGSKDGSVGFIENYCSGLDCPFEISLHKIEHNRDNFAKGMNFLFEKANPSNDDFILLLNNDIEFGDSKSLFNMVELQKETNADVVGARLLYPGTDILQHAGVIFAEKYGNMPYHYRHKEKSDEDAEKNRYFQAVTAAVVLIKAKAFRDVGGFDESFHWAFDDIDLILRIGSLKNNNVVYCGKTKIFHEESASLSKNAVNKLFLNSNVKYFKNKWSSKYELDLNRYTNDKSYNLVLQESEVSKTLDRKVQ